MESYLIAIDGKSFLDYTELISHEKTFLSTKGLQTVSVGDITQPTLVDVYMEQVDAETYVVTYLSDFRTVKDANDFSTAMNLMGERHKVAILFQGYEDN